jgi:general secretion pathway protein G
VTFHNRRDKGFTLIELMAVITIMAIIAALLVAAATGARRNAMTDRARADVKFIASKIDAYRNKRGEMPPDLNADGVTTEMEIYQTLDQWGYTVPEDKKVDPWGNPYIIVLQRDYGADFNLSGASMGYNATPFVKMQNMYRPVPAGIKTKAIHKGLPPLTSDTCYENQDNGYQVLSAGPDGKVCRYDSPTDPDGTYDADNITNWQQ